jgi:type VI protein secretion system component Hcp
MSNSLDYTVSLAPGTFMKFPGIKGDVTVKGYEGYILVEDFHIETSKSLKSARGHAQHRKGGKLNISEVSIIKAYDQSAPQLLQKTLTCKTAEKDPVSIVCVTPDNQKYLEITLTGVIVSSYDFIYDHEGLRTIGLPWVDFAEHLTLNFTEIEKKFTSHDATGKGGGSISASHDLVKG